MNMKKGKCNGRENEKRKTERLKIYEKIERRKKKEKRDTSWH